MTPKQKQIICVYQAMTPTKPIDEPESEHYYCQLCKEWQPLDHVHQLEVCDAP